MKIHEFVEKMAVRFDSKLQTPAQIAAFEEDCRDDLKPFEGEILGYAFHQIKGDAKHRTHPTMGTIRKICNEKMTNKHLETNARNPEQEKWNSTNDLIAKFKLTDQFAWCCKNMIGNDVIVHIRDTGKTPTQEQIQKLLGGRESFTRNMDDMKHDNDLSEMELAVYKTGKSLDHKNREYFEQFRGVV